MKQGTISTYNFVENLQTRCSPRSGLTHIEHKKLGLVVTAMWYAVDYNTIVNFLLVKSSWYIPLHIFTLH